MTMTRIEPRALLAVCLSLALLAYVGCGRTVHTTDPADTSKRSNGDTPPVGDANAKLFADWKGLQATIVITGQMDGYLDPCGCTEGQLGGLGRRYDLLEKMKTQKIPAVLVDLGSLAKDPASARGGPAEAHQKFLTALEAYEMMGYDAVGLSPEDLKLGIVDTLSVYLNHKDKLKIVAANVAPAGELKAAFADTIRPTVIAQAGSYKIGITSVVDPAVYAALKDSDREALAVTPPDSVLPDVLKTLEAGSDLQVLMVQGPPEFAKALGEKFPGFEFVVSTSIFADPPEKPEMINNGGTQVVSVGQQGKYVGVVGLFAPTKGKAPETQYRRVALNPRFKNAEPMRQLIDETMQEQLKSLRVVEDYRRVVNVGAPAGATYVGADECKSCHPNTYLKWEGTRHAHAYEVLAKNPKDPRRNREFDAECITCHTVGLEYVSGWVSPEKTPYLKGNQCENCHGPASKHLEQPDNLDFRRAMALNPEKAEKGLCHKCHDQENSPHFDFKTFYPKIAHKGMDNYADPRVHKGKTPAHAVAGK
jgi:2',3'-cyclic-nucleotide 2'-phosphodiesterase (5'-nucleotidase family)